MNQIDYKTISKILTNSVLHPISKRRLREQSHRILIDKIKKIIEISNNTQTTTNSKTTQFAINVGKKKYRKLRTL